MSFAKVAVAGGLLAIALSACGIQEKPLVGTANVNHLSGNHAKVDDPRVKHVKCLRADGLRLREYYTAQGIPAIQVGSYPSGPTILFYNSPGYAEGLKMAGKEQGGELIGAAVMYPNRAPGWEASQVEYCAAIGVPG